MATSIQTPGGLKVLNPQPEISKYYNAAGTPYTGTAQVLSELASGVRHIGLTVNIAGVEYWFKSGVADGNLVKKAFEVADNSTTNTQAAGDNSTKLATTEYADRATAPAMTTANEAKASADAATATANTASTNASNALYAANSASAGASEATSVATSARDYAQSIVGIANDANSTAQAANATAEAAVPAAVEAATQIMGQLTQYDLSFQLYLYNNFI